MNRLKQNVRTLPFLALGKQLGICAFLMLGCSQMAFAQNKVSYKG